MTFEELWSQEERLWLGSRQDYAKILHPAVLMAFSEVGVLDAEAALESVKGQRWTAVSITDGVLKQIGDTLVVLGYRAHASKGTEKAYRCVCTSSYAREDGEWRLVQHQQSAET